jgi:ATP-dependent exoDNAse (exonuclease V) beta subunit
LFENSQLGKQFLVCKNAEDFFKAEYGFRLYHENTIFTGSIDLIFKNQNGKYTIVDYKTDEKIEPEVHKQQQQIYKIAATQLLKCNPEQIECYLFYLLHNKEVKLDL